MIQAKLHLPSSTGNSQKLPLLESEQIIQLNHPEKYRTSEWYTGHGEIAASGDGCSFEISATYALKAEVKLVDGVFQPSNQTLANVYSRRGRCVAIVDKIVDELYGASLRHYFNYHGIPLKLLACRAWEVDKTPETAHRLLQFLGKDSCDVSRNEPVLVVGPDDFICVDNTLLQGQPYLPPQQRTPNGEAIAQFNRLLADDPRVEQVLLPLRDGLTIIRRK